MPTIKLERVIHKPSWRVDIVYDPLPVIGKALGGLHKGVLRSASYFQIQIRPKIATGNGESSKEHLFPPHFFNYWALSTCHFLLIQMGFQKLPLILTQFYPGRLGSRENGEIQLWIKIEVIKASSTSIFSTITHVTIIRSIYPIDALAIKKTSPEFNWNTLGSHLTIKYLRIPHWFSTSFVGINSRSRILKSVDSSRSRHLSCVDWRVVKNRKIEPFFFELA